MEAYEELRAIAQSLERLVQHFDTDGINKNIEELERAISEVASSFSGSWIGYHAYIYYDGLKRPPAGAHFNSLMGNVSNFSGTRGNWVEYDPQDVKNYILANSNVCDMEILKRWEYPIRTKFEEQKSEIISVLSDEQFKLDEFLMDILKQVKSENLIFPDQVINSLAPRKVMTADYSAVGQGFKTPPHISLLADVCQIKHTVNACISLARFATNSASHIQRKSLSTLLKKKGTQIFIGHGQSPVWRDLKDFLQDRLDLPWDEFNRMPVAGVTNIFRLAQMLDNACFAFLVLTAEDEMADGGLQARMNVIHEVGLFQGRLGFEKAIVLLEDGCEEFLNINGLGQIRFPKGNIGAKFEEIRRVLERESIIQ